MTTNRSTRPDHNEDHDAAKDQRKSTPPQRSYASRGDYDTSYQGSSGRGSYSQQQGTSKPSGPIRKSSPDSPQKSSDKNASASGS